MGISAEFVRFNVLFVVILWDIDGIFQGLNLLNGILMEHQLDKIGYFMGFYWDCMESNAVYWWDTSSGFSY